AMESGSGVHGCRNFPGARDSGLLPDDDAYLCRVLDSNGSGSGRRRSSVQLGLKRGLREKDAERGHFLIGWRRGEPAAEVTRPKIKVGVGSSEIHGRRQLIGLEAGDVTGCLVLHLGHLDPYLAALSVFIGEIVRMALLICGVVLVEL